LSGPVTIRRAAPGDYEVICEMAELMDLPQLEALPGRFRKPSGPARLRDPDTFLAVAELENRVVGVANTGLLRMGDYPQKHPITSLLVRGIVVRPELRRQRIASALVEKAIEWARANGATEVQANVYDFNRPAATFFASLGLAPLSHRLSRRFDA